MELGNVVSTHFLAAYSAVNVEETAPLRHDLFLAAYSAVNASRGPL